MTYAIRSTDYELVKLVCVVFFSFSGTLSYFIFILAKLKRVSCFILLTKHSSLTLARVREIANFLVHVLYADNNQASN